MHFSKALLASLGLFVSCVVYLTVSLGSYSSKDEEVYAKLLRGETEDFSLTEKKGASNQERSGLQKDLLLSGKNGLTELRLLSVRSELALEQNAGHLSIIEKMEDVTCFMQEEVLVVLSDGSKAVRQSDGRFLLEGADPAKIDAWLSQESVDLGNPMQIIRRLDASTATYHYKNDLFVAENVTVGRYLASGHDLAQVIEMQPLMKGVAKSVDFSLKGSDRNFHARNFRAAFYPERRS